MKSFFIGNTEVKTPIIQGGMGIGISLSGLASAVANEGGIGVISCAGLGLLYSEEKGDYAQKCIRGLEEEIRKARQKTNGIIGVNIMGVLSNYADMVCTAIREKADIIFSGAGLPLDLPSYLTQGSSTKLIPIVSSARAAKIICDKWQKNYAYLPDAIVVEGPKAGGHLGFKKAQLKDENYALESLVPQVLTTISAYKDIKNIPVIALSARDDMHEKEYQEAGFSAYLNKPYTPEQLYSRVNDLLGCAIEMNQPTTQTSDKNAPYNLDMIMVFADNDKDAANQIIGSFISDCKTNFQLLAQHLESHETEQIAKLAHKMLPMFKQLAINDVIPSLLFLEKMPLDTEENKIRESIEKILQEGNNVLQLLEKETRQ